VELVLHDYDYLITKKKLEEDDKLEDYITPITEFKTLALGDGNLRELKKGDIIQLERKGYYICDTPFDAKKPLSPIDLIFIPDGKQASLTSKANEGQKEEGQPAKVAKAAKKVEKAEKTKPVADQVVNGVETKGMYTVQPVYEAQGPLDHSKVSKMYAMKSVYDGQEEPVLPGSGKKKQAAEVNGEGAKVPGGRPKKDKKEKAAAKQAPPTAKDQVSLISKLDIVVGKILDVKKHPDADALYVENIDCGEAEPRVVVSGLVKFMKPEDMEVCFGVGY
jgi:glutamyl-tRNA synthetase